MSYIRQSMSDYNGSVDHGVVSSPSRPPRLRDRTRAALLTAAIEVLTDDAAASMGDIATAAGVARSTLNRYFPDRASLLEQIESFVEAQYDEAVLNARTEHGTGLAAYVRIVDELLERLDSLGWWLRAADENDVDDFACEADRSILAVIQRGQRDGTLDSTFSAVFLVSTTWSLLTSARYAMRHGQQPRREIREMCREALVKLATARAAPAVASSEPTPR